MRQLIHTPSEQRGFSLVEIMVSILVVSVGLLGVLGMQGLSLKSNLDNEVASHVTLLVEDMLSRVRVNINAYPSNYTLNTASMSAACPANDAHWASSLTLVQKNECEWRRMLEEVQPGLDNLVGQIEVNTAASGPDHAIIFVRWQPQAMALVNPSPDQSQLRVVARIR